MVEFCYNMDIYDTNMEYIKNYNYDHSLLRYYVIITQSSSSNDDLTNMILSSFDNDEIIFPKIVVTGLNKLR